MFVIVPLPQPLLPRHPQASFMHHKGGGGKQSRDAAAEGPRSGGQKAVCTATTPPWCPSSRLPVRADQATCSTVGRKHKRRQPRHAPVVTPPSSRAAETTSSASTKFASVSWCVSLLPPWTRWKVLTFPSMRITIHARLWLFQGLVRVLSSGRFVDSGASDAGLCLRRKAPRPAPAAPGTRPSCRAGVVVGRGHG